MLLRYPDLGEYAEPTESRNSSSGRRTARFSVRYMAVVSAALVEGRPQESVLREVSARRFESICRV